MGDPIYEWQKLLDERQKKELDLAILYAHDFHHGTTGHNQLMLIAALAEMLNCVEGNGTDIKRLYEPKGDEEQQ
jgi:hypothetical protein